MKRKKIIIIVVLFISIIVSTGLFIIGDKRKKDAELRFYEVTNSFEKALKKHIDASFVIKDNYNCHNFIEGFTTSDGLISNTYLTQNEMLDIDGVSLCKGVAREYIEFTPNSNNICEMKYDIYVKCKNHMTPGFDEQDYRDYINLKK